MRLFSYIFLFLLTTWQLIAQTYPVQVVPMLTPPYSSKIADYANPMANRVQLQLITTDLSVQNRSVQLYVEIKGNGLTAASAPVLSGISPLRISGGEILRLTNAELASYFQLRNLQGITSQQYTSALPDGMYSFCFRVKDVLSGRWLSQSHCAIAYLMLNDPPILNIPTDNEQVAVTDFQNIIFSWTPRQINATNITYSFELREILDPALDPRFAFEVSRRILKEDDLRMTTFVYDVSKPNLIPGRRYAWRVRAISTGGLAENSVFKNNGYSEVHSFVYAVNCSKPLFLLSQQQGKNRTKLLWQGHTLHQKYHIQYRKKGVANAQWFEASTRNTQTLITDLEAGEYEFRVGATCETERYGINPSYVYSDIQTFKIEKTQNTTESAYNCGIVPKIAITNQKPLGSLVTNEVFVAGDFSVTILEVSGNNGIFSGKGFIKVPYLNDTKLAVEFENVKINADYQLTDGVVKTTYDSDWKGVQFAENLIGQGEKSKDIDVPFEIEKVETRNGEIVVIGKDGRKEVFPFAGNDSSVKGKVTTTTNGVTTTEEKIYHIDKDGKVSTPQAVAQGGKPTKENTNGVTKEGEVTALTAKGIEVTFENTADSKYAYEVPTKAYSKDYQKMDGKYIPFKAVVKDQTEPFLAKVHITDKNISADSLIFKTDKGALIESKRVEGSNDFLLTLKGFHSFAVEQVQATIKQGKKYQIAGVFNLVHLSPKTAKVVLVPTAENLSIDTDRVKAIYSKIGVTLDITWATPFDITPYLSDGVLETKDVFGDLTDYSLSQQKIINAYKATGEVANDTYYVFITNAKSSTGQGGYMALGGQFGFVFDQTARTLAHELGHGIFKLAHPFKKKQQGNVPSLMDYTSDEALLFADWKQINDPAFKIGIFQGQGEGESYQVRGGIPKEWFIKGIVSFLTPSKQIVNLSNIKQASFSFGVGDQKYSGAENRLFPPGVLVSYIKVKKGKEIEYKARYENGLFKGYFNGENEDTYLPKEDNQTVIIRILTQEASKYIRISDTGLMCIKKGQAATPIWNILKDNTLSGRNLKELSTFEYGKGQVVSGLTPTDMRLEKDYIQLLQLDLDLNSYSSNVLHLNNLYAKIYELKILNPYLFDKFTTSFNQWRESDIQKEININKLKEFAEVFNFSTYTNTTEGLGYFEYLLWKNKKFEDERISVDKKREMLIYFIEEFSKIINSEYYKNDNVIKELLECNNNSKLFSNSYSEKQVQELFQTLNLDDQEKICIPIRLELINKLLKKTTVLDGTEKVILQILKTTPKYQQAELLVLMFNNENTKKYNLIERFSAVDDTTVFIGDDNYTALMKIIASFYKKLLETGTEEALSKIDNNTTYDEVIGIRDHRPFNENILKERYINFNYNNVTKRLLFSAIPFSQMAWEATFNDGKPTEESTVKYDKESNKINYKNYTIVGFAPDKELKNVFLDPLSPIIIANNSELGNLYKVDTKKQLKYVPAVMLYFINKKADSKTIGDSISTAVDLVSLAIPGGQATTLAKLLNYADKVSSVLSLAGNLLEDDNEELSTVLNISSGVLGVTNVISLKGKPISAASFDLEVGKNIKYENIVKKLAEDVRANASEIAANSDAKNIQIRILDNEIALAQANNKSEIVNELQKAKEALNKAKNISKLVYRNIKYDDFIKTFEATEEQYQVAFKLWGEEKWDELYKFFRENRINEWNGVVWPPYNGFSKVNKTIPANKYTLTIDRFQKEASLGGGFGSPILRNGEGVESLAYTYDSRMLSDELGDGIYYFSFRMSDKVSDVQLKIGDVAPWFSKSQNLAGEQIEFSQKLHKLDANYFNSIEAQVRIKGEWRKCVIEGKSVVTEIQDVLNKLPKSVADDIVDFINTEKSRLQYFKNAQKTGKLDKAIEAYNIYKKNKQKVILCP